MDNEQTNTVIVGAGPIGIEIAATLKRNKIDYIHIEAGQIGHSITRWMPQTVFFSSPEWIALCGIPIQTADQRQIDGESYLAYMRQLVELLELPVRTFERVTNIVPITDAVRASRSTTDGAVPRTAPHAEPDAAPHADPYTEPHTAPDAVAHAAPGAAPHADPYTEPHTAPDAALQAAPRFKLTTEGRFDGARHYYAQNVVLAVGNMQEYNRIAVPGVDQPHVSHTLADPHLYFRRKLLIVGGKNSALEAALRCWRAGANVTVSHRRPQLSKRGVLDRIFLETKLLIKNKKISLRSHTYPVSFGEHSAILHDQKTGARQELPTDFVYLATGFHPDNTLYEQLGVQLIGDEQRPRHNPRTMETNIRGVFVAGTAVAGNQKRYTVFITTCHHHAQAIAIAISGNRNASAASGNHPTRNYPLTDQELE